MISFPGIQEVLVPQCVSRPFHPLHFLLLTLWFSPGPINCFSSLDELESFWNGSLVLPRVDIKYGFSDPSDLAYFQSQVNNTDQKLQAFGEVCLKHESAQFLPYVGTAAAVRDVVAIAEYFDGQGCDINYYGFSYGTTIGNYLINSKFHNHPISFHVLSYYF